MPLQYRRSLMLNHGNIHIMKEAKKPKKVEKFANLSLRSKVQQLFRNDRTTGISPLGNVALRSQVQFQPTFFY